MNGSRGRIDRLTAGHQAGGTATDSRTAELPRWDDDLSEERDLAVDAVGLDPLGDWHAALAKALKLGLLERTEVSPD